MSSTKEDRNFRSYSGKDIRSSDSDRRIGAGAFALQISEALKEEYGNVRHAVETIVNLVGANERSVKNWFYGRNAPSGEFLVMLCRHSGKVLDTVLFLAERQELTQVKRLLDLKGKLSELKPLIDDIARI